MPTVSIGSANEYEVYADTATADEYLEASITAEAWRDADATTKARALVSATRWIDGLRWAGAKADDSQPLAWPRSGIDGVDESAVPVEIEQASIALAALLADDPDFQTTMTQAVARMLKAGSVAIEYFRGDTVQTKTPFPKPIMAKIGQWLDLHSGGVVGAFAGGVCAESAVQRYDRRRGL